GDGGDMAHRRGVDAVRNRLPLWLRTLFWDYDFNRLTWQTDTDLIIGRVLAAGNWKSIRWLLARLEKPALRAWLERRRGAGLSARQLRFWEVILPLPREQ